MPALVMSLRNASSTELTATAVPAVAKAASPRAPARSAVPANVVRRCVANIGLLGDVVLFRMLSGPTSESDRCLGGFSKDSWRRGAGRAARSATARQPYWSHHLCRSSMLGPWASASNRSEFLDHTRSGLLL